MPILTIVEFFYPPFSPISPYHRILPLERINQQLVIILTDYPREVQKFHKHLGSSGTDGEERFI